MTCNKTDADLNQQVSIIIPNYNNSRFLTQCLESVVNQSHKNLSCIVVDDCSSDQSVEVIRRFQSKHSFFSSIRMPRNSGVGASRNAGISQIHKNCDYIFFLDSDDFLKPDAIEKLLGVAVSDNADIVHCRSCLVDAQNRESGETHNSTLLPYGEGPGSISEVSIMQDKDLLIFPNVWNKLFKWERVKHLRFIEKRFFAEDYWYSLQAEFLSRKTLIYQQELHFFREQLNRPTENSLWNTSSLARARNMLDCFRELPLEVEKLGGRRAARIIRLYSVPLLIRAATISAQLDGKESCFIFLGEIGLLLKELGVIKARNPVRGVRARKFGFEAKDYYLCKLISAECLNEVRDILIGNVGFFESYINSEFRNDEHIENGIAEYKTDFEYGFGSLILPRYRSKVAVAIYFEWEAALDPSLTSNAIALADSLSNNGFMVCFLSNKKLFNQASDSGVKSYAIDFADESGQLRLSRLVNRLVPDIVLTMIEDFNTASPFILAAASLSVPICISIRTFAPQDMNKADNQVASGVIELASTIHSPGLIGENKRIPSNNLTIIPCFSGVSGKGNESFNSKIGKKWVELLFRTMQESDKIQSKEHEILIEKLTSAYGPELVSADKRRLPEIESNNIAIFLEHASKSGKLRLLIQMVASWVLIEKNHAFDRDFYLARYPDVQEMTLSPLLHWLRVGVYEMRDPSANFSTRRYIESNLDVARSGMNPLLHYIQHGRFENR